MSPEVWKTFADIVGRRVPATGRIASLEVGAGGWTLLSIPTLDRGPRIALNLRFDKPTPELAATTRLIANGNELPFPDDTFDCVLSCSALEHDRWFWRSTREARRVLRPGGHFVVGVPIYMTLPQDKDFTTVTYARHGLAYNADFYRFSEQAVREVFFEGYTKVTDEVVVRRQPNPYLVAAGVK